MSPPQPPPHLPPMPRHPPGTEDIFMGTANDPFDPPVYGRGLTLLPGSAQPGCSLVIHQYTRTHSPHPHP